MAINSFPEWIRLLYALQDNGRYEGLIRLEGTEMFETERAFLERVIERTVEKIVYKRPIYDSLSDYFSLNEISPSIILNNDVADNQLNVWLGEHR